MAQIDDSQAPYNDRFKLTDQLTKLLFSPSRPLFQSELNEMQSNLLNQVTLLGNSQFREGSVISGMGMVPQGTLTGDTTTTVDDDTNPNLITYDSISSYDSKIDLTDFKDSGLLHVTSTATTSKSYPGFQVVTGGAKGGEMSLSFTIQETSGTLYSITGLFDSSIEVETYTIDGVNVATPFDNQDPTSLVDTSGNQINLGDGAKHTVAVTFDRVGTGTYTLTILANAGYNAINEGMVNFDIDVLKAESGADVTPWVLATSDVDTSTGKERNQVIRILDGYVYLGGIVRQFKQQDIDITGVGAETIGLELDETIVTAVEDPTLLDNTVGAVSEWKRGADRLRYSINLTYNDPTTATLMRLQDGKIVNDVNKPDSAVLNDILAKRTKDESGSYRVSGFDLWSKKDTLDSSVVDLVVDSGTAYVQGYQIIKGTSTTIQISKAVGTQDMKDEVFLYTAKSDQNGKLANQPVKTVNQVSGNVQIVDEAVNRSASTAVNDVLANPAYEIDQVYWVDANKKKNIYKLGTDYLLTNGNQIKWDVSDAAVEPPQGATYYVTYQYQKVFTYGTDYNVATTGEENNQVTTVTFQDMPGAKPIEGSQVHVSYTYFLARVDVVTLDKDGNFKIISGQPDMLSSVQPPMQVDPLTLQIGYVTVFPNSSQAKTQLATITRITFQGLQDVVSRVQQLEANIATQAMNDSAMANTDPVTLRNVFSDSFTDVQKADLGNKDFTAAYLFDTGEITVPIKAEASLQPSILDTASSLHKFSHMVTTPFTEYAAISQPAATGTKNVNPYKVFNILGTLHISPEVDNWIDTSSTTIYSNGANETLNQGRWWIHGLGTTAMQNYKNTDDTIVMDDGTNLGQYLGENGNWTSTATGTITQNLGVKTIDSEVEFIRPQTITFKAENLLPLEDNLKLTFDGQEVAIKPATGYLSGTDAGSIKANADGIAEGTFEIPTGVKTGVREVKLASPNVSATATYTAQGTDRLNETMIQRTRVTVNFTDPLAQSFAMTADAILTSVDLYFAAKPTQVLNGHRSDIVVQIRSMGDQGYPSREILSETTVPLDKIQTSTDGTAQLRVYLPDPLQVTSGDSLCVVIITDSADYEMFIAQSGAQRIDGAHAAMGQPYVEGTLFDSANSQTWTAQQDMDLKFKVNAGTFSDTGIVAFDTIYPKKEVYRDGNGNPLLDTDGKQIPMTINQIVLLANYLTPGNTGMSWQVKIVTDDQPDNITVNDVEWQPLNVDTEKDLIESAREIQFRALFTASNKLSPILATDSLSLATFLMHTQGTYLSRNIDMSDSPFNHIRIQYEAYLPDKATAIPKYSLDGGKTWVDLSKATTSTKNIDRNFTQYTYELQLYDQAGGDHTTADQFKTRIDLTAQSSFKRPTVRRLRCNMTLEDGDETGIVTAQ